jgi:hypothetical protein
MHTPDVASFDPHPLPVVGSWRGSHSGAADLDDVLDEWGFHALVEVDPASGRIRLKRAP